MIVIHLQDLGNYRMPKCWSGRIPAGYEEDPDVPDITAVEIIDEVDCVECLRMALMEDKTTPSFELYLDGPSFEDAAGWRQPVVFSWERFRADDWYANLVSDYITRSLAHLAKEVEEIGLAEKTERQD